MAPPHENQPTGLPTPATMDGRQCFAAQSQHRDAPRLAKQFMKKNTDEPWRHWLEVTIQVTGLPMGITTLELHRAFDRKGYVLRIDISDHRNGQPVIAFVVFSPPPSEALWEAASFPVQAGKLGSIFNVRLDLRDPQRSFSHQSPVNKDRTYFEKVGFIAHSLDFGVMLSQNKMMVMKTVESEQGAVIRFSLNLLRREIEVEFPCQEKIGHCNPQPVNRKFRFRFPLTRIERMHESQLEGDKRALIIPLDIPPEFFRQKHDIAATHDDQAKTWSRWKTWTRQTHLGEDLVQLQTCPIRLGGGAAVINIGSWTTYRIVFDNTKIKSEQFENMLQALRDYNVSIPAHEASPIALEPREESRLRSLLDLPERRKSAPPSNIGGLDEMEHNLTYLPFPVRYQLEVCLSQGCLNEYNVNEVFLRKLAALNKHAAIDLLERVADIQRRFFEPMDIFNLSVFGTSARGRVPNYCVELRAATVTPTTILFASPAVEITNRVIRRFWEHRDRFLRVKFTDEKNNGRINSVDDDSQDEVFERIRRTMRNGIIVGDWKFEFVAFGNSQFREHGAFFFASTRELTAADIRYWMGWDEIKEIKSVAKRCARLGQCLSTTRAINSGNLDVEYIADTKSHCGNYCFTDGVGKISLLVASLIVAELGLPTAHNDFPSVFQFRCGGAKGVLAVDPDMKGNKISLRESQYKFDSKHKNLEIIRASQFAAATANRQLIILLSFLGVPDEVFLNKLINQLAELDLAMEDEQIAVQLLQNNIDVNQMTLTLAGVIKDGFMKAKDPFVMSMLRLWRSWSIKFLKEKAKIFIEKGACLLGCVDESGKLQGHYDQLQPDPSAHREVKEKTLPEIFVRVDFGKPGKYQVIEGVCILCRNPSLHPGDIRVVRAVDKPELYHLKNVVVLPHTGDRDLASMCSGGDLDGDDFLVIWDQELLPDIAQWNYEPMDFAPPAVPQLRDREPTVDDMINFFVTYMKNDRLPTIAHAHLALADYYCLDNKRCIELARLHSDAVDYPKSGVPARMRPALRPPIWPHFMEKKHKPADKIYHSKKILGKLYDLVEKVDYSSRYETPFDSRILDAYNLDEQKLQEAAEIKETYDAAIKRVMAQHDIRTELEVWSTFCLSHNFDKKDFTFAEEQGRTTSALKERFRTICITKAGGRTFEKLGPFVAAMYAVTARQVQAALAAPKEGETEDEVNSPSSQTVEGTVPFVSFPWLFERELGKIANGLSYKSVDMNGQEAKPAAPYSDVELKWEEWTSAEIIGGIRKEMEEHKGVRVDGVDEEHVKMVEDGIKRPQVWTSAAAHTSSPEIGGPVQIQKPSLSRMANGSRAKTETPVLKSENEGGSGDGDSASDDGLVNGISHIRLDTGTTGLEKLSELMAQAGLRSDA